MALKIIGGNLLDEQYDREMKEYLELHHQWKLFKLEEAKRKYVS